MTYPISFRRKVLSVREKEGLTIVQTAARFCVGIASVTRWIKNPVPQETRNKPATKIDMAALARDVREFPDAYQAERARRLGVSEKGIGHALRRMNISYKNTAASQSGRRRTAHLPGRRLKRIKLKTVSSSILMKVVLLTICHEHTGTRPLASDVMGV
ncbi:IS630 transposase-related protein [Nitrosomonas sp. H1_AOB3]|uniref:IS630 transposase-related protein n=1 Tax=Nitrosomonas sp. H1_AOB3 TaxID=2741553 RepID=UPI00257EFE62|nr:IS630 transposase-related protein [Nitrosomonas sp. H1_AOB3]